MDNYLIRVPRDKDGKIIREKLEEFIHKPQEYNENPQGKRKTFFHRSSKVDFNSLSKFILKKTKIIPKKDLRQPGRKLTKVRLYKKNFLFK